MFSYRSRTSSNSNKKRTDDAVVASPYFDGTIPRLLPCGASAPARYCAKLAHRTKKTNNNRRGLKTPVTPVTPERLRRMLSLAATFDHFDDDALDATNAPPSLTDDGGTIGGRDMMRLLSDRRGIHEQHEAAHRMLDAARDELERLEELEERDLVTSMEVERQRSVAMALQRRMDALADRKEAADARVAELDRHHGDLRSRPPPPYAAYLEIN